MSELNVVQMGEGICGKESVQQFQFLQLTAIYILFFYGFLSSNSSSHEQYGHEADCSH